MPQDDRIAELEEQVRKLEAIARLQQESLSTLGRALEGHGLCIEAFAKLLNIEIRQEPPAPAAPLN